MYITQHRSQNGEWLGQLEAQFVKEGLVILYMDLVILSYKQQLNVFFFVLVKTEWKSRLISL